MKMLRYMCAFTLFVLLFAALATPTHAQSAPNLAGDWQGTAAGLRLILTLESASAGTWKGKIVSLDQGNAIIPVDTISFDHGTLHLELKAVGASYDGKLNAAGDELAGTWSQGGNSMALSFRRAAASLAAAAAAASSPAATQSGNAAKVSGEWRGMISTVHLIFNFGSASGETFSGKVLSPDQGNAEIAVETGSVSATGAVHVELRSIGATFDGQLAANGNEISGNWVQGGNTIALRLRRPGAAAAASSLQPRKIGTVSFQPCRTPDGNTEGLCAKYEVFENRESKSGRKISLNIMVLPAVSDHPAPDPFIPLAGGPGQSAVEAFTLAGFTTKIRQQRDVVLIDQRGTGHSNPLQCDFRDPKDPNAVLGETILLDRLRACRTNLEVVADLTQYTTPISADDLDEVRQALGYDKISLFGGSYGTRAALIYLRMHGEHVRSIALEAVAPPEYRIPLSFSRTIQSSVDRLIARCEADATCHADFPNLKSEFVEILARLDKSPATFQIKRNTGETQSVTLSRGTFVGNLRPILYLPPVISEFPYLIHSAYQGDWTPLGTVVLTFREALEKVIARGMSLSVICTEDIAGVTEESIHKETAGTYLGDFQVRYFQKGCHEWPEGHVPANLHDPVRSAVPALLISGALDPATPPEASQAAARALTNSHVIVVKEGTHGTGSPCLDGIVAQFVAYGSAEKIDTACVDQIHLPPFVTQKQIDQAKAQQSGKD